jgi:ornithine carbamoyltransferase
MTTPQHFLDLDRLDTGTLRGILDQAVARKSGRAGLQRGVTDSDRPLEGRILAMIFEKPSTRTRVSFDVAMRQLGGQTIEMNGADMQMGRGETVADTARVLSRYVDAIMIRTDRHDLLLQLAEHASVPVINGLTDRTHPCQVMADIMTFEEHRGTIADRRVAWSGDGNNVAVSWMHAATRFGFEFVVACPDELSPPEAELAGAIKAGGRVRVLRDPEQAVDGADCVVTDTWVSMSDENPAADSGRANRHNLLAPYQGNAALMSRAKPDALFMHCLPAHRGEEVTADVIDGPQSVVWDEAENRLHAQKSILTWCLS